MARERFSGGGAIAADYYGPVAYRRETARRDWVTGGRGMVALALVASGLGAAHSKDESAGAVIVASPVEGRVARTAASVLDHRVQLVARELALDATQQVRLRGILQAQRDDIARAWRDPSVPAALRIAATQTIGEKTADRIRAILTDEQREKYMKSHQHDAPGGDVERWMKAGEGSARSPGPAFAKGS